MSREPVLFLVSGGTVLIQAVLQLLLAFGVPISPTQQAAITSLGGIVLGILVRMCVTPMATLPPGVADKLANPVERI